MKGKFIIYQILVRAFGNESNKFIPGGSLVNNGCGKFNDISSQRLNEIKQLSVSYIWYTGIIEHATKTDYSKYGIKQSNNQIVKGEAGSPYAIKDYYDVDPDLAVDVNSRMDEFYSLIKRTKEADLKTIIDFVPNHLAREYYSDSKPAGIEDFGINDDITKEFSPNNNFYYLPKQKLDISDILDSVPQSYIEIPAKVSGNDCFSNKPSKYDWYDTVKLNYGVDYSTGNSYFSPIPKTWKMMLDVLLFWVSKGVDGFRCDMAEMVPVEFWQWAITQVKEKYPGIIFIGELYNQEKYDLYLNIGKFDYLYDKVGLYDTLKLVSQSKLEAYNITNVWQKIDRIQNKMLNFLENHDEQRIASNYNLSNPFYAIPWLTISLMLNRAPFMIYAGQEFGEKGMLNEGYSTQDGRTSIFDYSYIPALKLFFSSNLDKESKELYDVYTKLCYIAINERAINKGDTYDLEYANEDYNFFDSRNQYVFARKTRKTIQDFDAKEELIIIFTNFRQNNNLANISLPKDFFKHWNITENNTYESVNLLSGKDNKVILSSNSTLKIEVNEYGIAIIKIVL